MLLNSLWDDSVVDDQGVAGSPSHSRLLCPGFWYAEAGDRVNCSKGLPERIRSRFGLDEGPTRFTPPPAIGRLCLRPKPVILTPGTDTARIVTNGLVNRVDNGIFHEHDVESLRHPCPSSCRQPSTACSTAAIEPAMSFPSLTGA